MITNLFSVQSFQFYSLFLLLFPPFDTDGAQKLRAWLGDPSWITGENPPARYLTGLVSYKDNLYIYGGTTDTRGGI
jgi:hypothetical protein